MDATAARDPLSRRLWRRLETAFREVILGDRDETGYVAPPIDAADGFLRTYGLSGLLSYDQYDPVRGLFYNDTSVGFLLDVVPQTGADEKLAGNLSALFSLLGPEVGLQWLLFGSPQVEPLLQSYVGLREFEAGASGSPVYAYLAQARVAHYRQTLGRSMWPDENFTVSHYRLVLSVSRRGSASDARLVERLADARDRVRTVLKTAWLPATPLDAQGLIDFLWPIVNPDTMYARVPITPPVYDPQRPLKTQVVRMGQTVRVRAQGLTYVSTDPGDREDIITRTFTVSAYPRRRELHEMVNLVGSLYDANLRYPCPFLISCGVLTRDRNEVEQRAQIRSVRATQNADSKMARYQPALAAQAEDWRIVMYNLDEGGSNCQLFHNLVLFAPRSQIDRAENTAVNLWQAERFTLSRLDVFHAPMWYASLPMTLNHASAQELARFRITSEKTTQNATDMAPVLAEWRGTGTPAMLLFGKLGQIVPFDFFDNRKGNYNFAISGVPGVGKSFFMNDVVRSYAGIGAKVFIIDVGRSYKTLIEQIGGAFLEFSPTSRICLNPFSWIEATEHEVDIDGETERRGFSQDLKLLKPFYGRLCSPSAALTDFQYSLVEKALATAWDRHGQAAGATEVQSILMTELRDERGEVDRQAWELGTQLTPYAKGGMYEPFFNGVANMRLDGDVVCLELDDLNDAPQLRTAVLFMVMFRIMHEMYLSRERRKVCIVDEAWKLLGDDRETAAFIEEGFRRARKYKGVFGVGTQGVLDFFKNDASRAAYFFADFKLFLRQDPSQIEEACSKYLNLAPPVRRMLESVDTVDGRYSEMLLICPLATAVLRFVADPLTYYSSNSRAEIFQALEALRAQGVDPLEAAERLARDHGHAL